MRDLRQAMLIGLSVTGLLLIGCQSSGGAADLLPTATPLPTLAQPTVTATALPPPTVTPFPTATPDNNPAPPAGDSANTNEEGAEGSPASTEGSASTDNPPDSAPTDAPQATAPAAPTATPQPPSSSVGVPDGVTLGEELLAVDFSQGWPTIDEDTAQMRLVNGSYQYQIGPFDARFITTSQLTVVDAYIQIDVEVTSCPEAASYGLIFRYTDAANYNLFHIFCDNRFVAVTRVNGSFSQTVGINETLPDGLTAGPGLHQLGILSQGNQHRLFFDGQEIGAFSDAANAEGDIALYAAVQSANTIDVSFDNLNVWALP
ncbi:MAG: hypothetical protein GYB68_04675 [Chloroflexi bacterium]|nr:hypothetical protein [Chloroflexota bacterium]